MKRARPAMSILTALATLTAWFAISNHCAIGATASKSRQSPNECPFHVKKSEPKKQPSAAPCCKILRAIPSKNLANAMVDLAVVDFSFAKLVVIAPPKICFHSATLDTGPPGKTSFAELIPSMRAHAPPSLA